MARARNLKPGFFTNGDLLECQPLARLLFAGLWTEADCRGILEDRPKTIKVKILPGDNCDVDELLNELQDAGFITRYQVGEHRCIFVKMFGKHQNPHQNEKPNALPAPECMGEVDAEVREDSGASTVQAPEQHESDPAESLLLNPSDESTPSRRRAKGSGYSSAFESFWTHYPKKVGKDAAWKIWQRLRPDVDVIEAMRVALEWQTESREWTKDGGQYIPNPATWLNAGRWKDAPPDTTQSGSAFFDGTQWRRADGLAY